MSGVVSTLTTPPQLADPNGNNDSGYAPSQPEIIPESPRKHRHQSKKNGATIDTELRYDNMRQNHAIHFKILFFYIYLT